MTPGIALADRADFRLGDAMVRPSLRTVEGPVAAVAAEPRVMQVLLVLADAGGAVVSRDELLQRCWDGRIVGDDSVNRAVAEVRRLARESGAEFGVETIPRIGYRLTGAISEAPALAREAHGGSKLSRRWVLAGATGAAAAAVGGIWWLRHQASADGFEPLVQAGLEAMAYGSPESFDRAAHLLARAVAIRPDDARAWGLLAMARKNVSDYSAPGQSPAAVEAARAAVDRALLLRGDEPNATTALIEIQGGILGWAGREDRLLTVMASDPRNIFALTALVALYQASGQDRISWDLNERAIAIDPLSPTPQYRRALKHWIYGRTAEADQAINRLSELWPRHPAIWNARFLILAFTGRPEAARAIISDERQRPESFRPLAVTTWTAALNALRTRSTPEITAARDAIFRAARLSPGLAAHGVMTLSALGEIDAAFTVASGLLLSKGPIHLSPPGDKRQLNDGPGWRYTQWLFTPPCAGLRADRRFNELCDGIGLTAYWRKRGIRPDYLDRKA
jgi:DNA-binding winged helix-turn-helix (wHTH) protein